MYTLLSKLACSHVKSGEEAENKMDRTDEQGCFGVQEKSAGACASENPPCNENGRKRGYIDVMKELWDDMGYKNLQLKSQNLRDQASRLEKIKIMEQIYPSEREVSRIWGISHLQVNILVRNILKMKVKTTKTEKVEMLILQQEA